MLVLGLPDHIKVECILGSGHPAELKIPVSEDKLERNKIKKNGWS